MVIDASVTLAWVHGDERTEAITSLFESVARQGAHVPSIWPLEVANSLLQAVRRGRTSPSLSDQAIADLEALDIAVDPETAHYAWRVTMKLAKTYGLTVYDAAYLELAQRRRLPLATLDKALAVAATKASVDLVI